MASKKQEVAVNKLIVRDHLTYPELLEVAGMLPADLVIEYGLPLDLAREVTNRIRLEVHRHRAQGFTWPESVDDPRKEFGYPKPPTRTRPIVESTQRSTPRKVGLRELRSIILREAKKR
jgi:hypothetical protein